MIGRRHAGGVRIPIENVEGKRFLAAQVIVDDVGPDQVVGAQQVEGIGHAGGFQIALLLHVLFEMFDALLVDEHQEVAAIGEIDLRREQGSRQRALLLLGGEISERDGEQRAADAIADGVDLVFAGHLLDGVERGDHALAHILFEAFLRELGVGIDPGHHEHGDALIDAPFDEGFLRRQIENVEFVDPGRHDQQRRLEHLLGGRLILDELDQVVLVDDLAGREREIFADLEQIRIGLADAQIAVAGLDVLAQHVHAAHQILGVGRERLAQQFRIGQHEIRRRDRVGDLLDVEAGFGAGVLVDAFGVLDQMVGPIGGEQIGLLEEVEELVLRPFRIGKALVARVGAGNGRGLLAGHAFDRAGPQIEIGAAKIGLQFERALGVG